MDEGRVMDGGTKPVLPRRGECHALSAVRGRNEERVVVLARRQERQEVVRTLVGEQRVQWLC